MEDDLLTATPDALRDTMRSLDLGDTTYHGEIAPRVHAFGARRAMGRIRAYSSAGLTPFAGRGMQNEFHLLGHVHLNAQGKATLVEGFNGAEGERWAKAAHERLAALELLTPDATLRPTTPLKMCPHSGVR